MSASLARASFTEASRAYRAKQPGWVVCPECEGLCTFYSDAGPSPREYDCDECGGAGGWDEIDTTICIAEQIARSARHGG